MRFIEFCLLLGAGFLLAIWYVPSILLSLLYGVPKALAGYFRKELSLKAIFAYLLAPVVCIVVLFLLFGGLAFFWHSAFEYLYESAAFNFGQALGTLLLFLRLLFGAETRADLRDDFNSFVAPYRITPKSEPNSGPASGAA